MFQAVKDRLTVANMVFAKFIFDRGIGAWHYKIHEFAMRRIQLAADMDYLPAQLLFGQLLKYRGLTVYNKLAGVGYLRKAAQQGSTDAMFMLAEALQDEGLVLLTTEPAEIYNLYLNAAQAGHIMAALRLSHIYKTGLLAVNIDLAQSEYWSEQFMQYTQTPKKVVYE